MKAKFYITFLLVCLFSTAALAQNLMVLNFEEDGTDLNCKNRYVKISSNVAIVSNPSQTGNNTSAKVLEISSVADNGAFMLNLVKSISASDVRISNCKEYDAIRFKYRVSNPEQYSSLHAVIKVNADDKYTSTAIWSGFNNDWKTAVFRFETMPTASVSQIQIEPYLESGEIDNEFKIYIDDIELVKFGDAEILSVVNFENNGTDRMCDDRFQKVGSSSDIDFAYINDEVASSTVMRIYNCQSAGGFHLKLFNVENDADKINAKEYDGLRLKYRVNDEVTFNKNDAIININGMGDYSVKGVWTNTGQDWKTVTFKFSDLATLPNTINSIHIIPYNGKWTGIGDLEIYIDDIELFKTENVLSESLAMISVDGQDVESFKPGIFKHSYKLPFIYSSSGTPVINYTQGSATQTVNVVPATDLTGNEDKRTARIRVMDNENILCEYQVIFEIMPRMDIYICLGQSNMSGYGTLLTEDEGAIDNTYLLNGASRFEPAVNPMNKYSTAPSKNGTNVKTSPAYGFAKALIGECPDPVGLLVNAVCGSSIEEWEKGNTSTPYYNQTVERALEAKKWGTIKGIIWHQGESNSTRSDQYPAQLTAWVNNFRTDLGDTNKDIFFVAGELGYWRGGGTGSTDFNNMIRTISNFLPNSDWASAEDLTYYKNDADPHFSRESAITLGERYAEKIIGKFYKTPVGIDDNRPSENTINYTLHGNKLTVMTGGEQAMLYIFDIYGRNLSAQKFTNEATYTFVTEGVHILVIENKDGTFTQKVCVK